MAPPPPLPPAERRVASGAGQALARLALARSVEGPNRPAAPAASGQGARLSHDLRAPRVLRVRHLPFQIVIKAMKKEEEEEVEMEEMERKRQREREK